MIRKTKSGYKVVSHSGKSLGEYKTKKAAEKRLRQVEYWKKSERKAIKYLEYYKRKK